MSSRLVSLLTGKPEFKKADGLRFHVSSAGALSIEPDSILKTKEGKAQLDALRKIGPSALPVGKSLKRQKI